MNPVTNLLGDPVENTVLPYERTYVRNFRLEPACTSVANLRGEPRAEPPWLVPALSAFVTPIPAAK